MLIITNKVKGPGQDIAYKDCKNVTWFGPSDLQGNKVVTWPEIKAKGAFKAYKELQFDEAKKLHLHIDLESIFEADGVSVYTPEQEALYTKFKALEISKIVQDMAVQGKISSMSITDYNPIAEDQRTGRLVATIFYQLCIGICQNKM